ncbi:MAG: hypothetical protein CL942_08455 [Desulfovibrio sp.]|nr:hypothetical protein [Desulfovibrio sp.]
MNGQVKGVSKDELEKRRQELCVWKKRFIERLAKKPWPSRRDRREFSALRRAINCYCKQSVICKDDPS